MSTAVAAPLNQRKSPPSVSYFKTLRMLPEFRRQMVPTFMKLTRELGHIYCFKGLWRTFVLTHPEQIEYVLQTNQRNYHKGRSYKLFNSSVGQGLLNTDGEKWRRQRRLAQPAFHRQRIASFAKTMTDAAEEMIERWRPQAERSEPLEVNSEMLRLALGIVGRTLFSRDMGYEADWVSKAFSVVREHMMRRMISPVKLPESVPTPRHLKFRKAMAEADKMVYGMIEERRRAPEKYEDLLSMLMEAHDEETDSRMSDKELRDETMTIIGAGYETITQALTWTWYLIDKHRAVEERLRAELADVLGGRTPVFEDLQNLKYTLMVFEEAMRLYPPIYALSRMATGEDEILGYRVRARDEIFLLPCVTHHHPDFWEKPEEFDPERFSPLRAAERPRFAYFPFGGGPRQCIGNSFALMEGQLIIATVLQKYRLRLVPNHTVVPEASVTLRPRHGMMMTIQILC